MGLKEIENIKKQNEQRNKKVSALSREMSKHNPYRNTRNPEKYDKKEIIAEDKAKAIQYYQSLSEGDKLEFNKQLQYKQIREDYAKYLKYVYGDNYKITRLHSFLATLCDSIVKRVEKGEKVRVLLTMPCQRGKSLTLTETLPSWFMGRNPDLRCIITSYNADTAERFGDRNRQKIKKYGKEIFGIEVSDSQDNKTLFNIKDHLGGMISTGLNGSLISNNGALIIVDDPFKSEIDANNPSKREEVWSNFVSAVMTRQRGAGNAIIVIHTRWHEDDLIGRILKSEVADEWVYVELPEVWEKGIDKILHRKIGETLCPELGFDSAWAESTRKTLGSKMWNAIYMCRPYSENGEIVQRSWLQFYNKQTIPTIFDEITMSCDLSFGGLKNNNDPVGIGIFGRVGGNHYLLDYVIKKMNFTDTLEYIRYFCGKYPQIKTKIIEAKANGNATMEVLNREIGGFIGYDPKGNSKETRLQLCLAYIESGNLFLPDETIKKDIEEQVQTLIKFPKVSHDEIVDITTQYLLNYQYKYGGRVNTDSKYSILARAIRGLKV